MESTESTRSNNNYFVRLINGEISLAITFWFYGVLSHLIIRLMNYLIHKNHVEIMKTENGELYTQIFYWFSIALSFFFMICIWRSANRYHQNRLYAILAQVLAFIALLSLFSDLYKNQGANEDVRIRQEIQRTNLDLPFMIDDETRFDSKSLKDRNIYFNYTLVNSDKQTFDEQAFIDDSWPSLIQTVCGDQGTKQLLEDNRYIFYRYEDSKAQLLTEIKIDLLDCD